MNNQSDNEKKLVRLVELLELPETAYDNAKSRYEDLGKWLDREGSTVASFNPHVYVQGSFALGTAIRPLNSGEEYDLDLSCKLTTGITTKTHTQAQVKEIMRVELEAYRKARKIKEELEEKRRCWRLQYRDQMSFHLDVVPSIPAEDTRRRKVASMMMENAISLESEQASVLANDSVWITDNTKPEVFNAITDEWQASNPEGYKKWFESRMMPSMSLALEARVDPVPLYKRKNNLQRSIQLLKRHRDQMFINNCDAKPISIIITTIAAREYRAGQLLEASMDTILGALNEFRLSGSSVLLNPVNPDENFADKWETPEGHKLRLKENFHRWVMQATASFEEIWQTGDAEKLVEQAKDDWAVTASLEDFSGFGGLSSASRPSRGPAIVAIETPPPKPWLHRGK